MTNPTGFRYTTIAANRSLWEPTFDPIVYGGIHKIIGILGTLLMQRPNATAEHAPFLEWFVQYNDFDIIALRFSPLASPGTAIIGPQRVVGVCVLGICALIGALIGLCFHPIGTCAVAKLELVLTQKGLVLLPNWDLCCVPIGTAGTSTRTSSPQPASCATSPLSHTGASAPRQAAPTAPDARQPRCTVAWPPALPPT